MRRLFLFLGIIFLFQFVQAEEISYMDSWGKAGLSLINSSTSGVEANFSITEFKINESIINSNLAHTVHLPGNFLPNEQGMPNLPVISKYIAFPQGADVQFEITASRTEMFTDLDIAPAPRIPFDIEDGALEFNKNELIYETDTYYPPSPVQISSVRKIRGVDAVIISITPFQYNPVTKDLVVYRDLNINISFNGGVGTFGDNRLRSLSWDGILQGMLLNYRSLPEIEYNRAYRESSAQTEQTEAAENVEYLIISPDDPVFLAWADSLRLFRNQQGISTGIVTTTEIGGNTTSAIETYVDNIYTNWTNPPSAILLLADYGNSGNTIMSSGDQPHPYSGTYVSDNYFADVDGDHLPDVIFSRITAQNAAHLENMVGKILDYERNPPTNPDFYNHPITAMGWQTERWFQICSESINGFWEHSLGKSPVRENAIYSGNTSSGWSTATNTATVVDYFGPNGLGYIPATPDHLTDWGGNASRINNDINSGAFMLQHRDHGGETGWGEPDYDINDMSGLHNSDLTFVFSINCLTGRFDYSSECFTEAFHRDSQRALGLIAATQVSYSFVNDTYTWGMYDNMWPQFMPEEETTFPQRFILPAFANAAGKYFLQGSSWPYNSSDKEITYYLFHHHGGSYSMVYSEVPQNLTVTHNTVLEANVTHFSVTVDDGSLIGLSVSGEIIGTDEGTGSAVDISIPAQQVGDTMLVTITKQNYFRYSSEVLIVNSSGAYVTIESWSIDDSGSGNNNGQADFGESVLLDVNAQNLGSEQAMAVSGTFASTDSYLTISDDTHFYGNIDTNAVVNAAGAFAFDVANNAPDQHSAACTVTFQEDGGGQWISNLSINVNAPVLSADELSIDDTATGNGDGNLDEGETVDFAIPVFNAGHADAPMVTAILSESSNDITITEPQFDVGNLAVNDTVNAIYEITADAATAAGTEIEFTLTVNSGAYTSVETYRVVVGDKIVYVMSQGSVTVRNGLFYDTGNVQGEYSTGEDITMTFYPDGDGPNVRFNFTSFELTGYDKLYIFDGPGTSSDQIAGSPFSGTDSPGEYTATGPDGSITFMFRSNPVFTDEGWAADIYSTAISGIDKTGYQVIDDYALLANYPNPFNPETVIQYQLPEMSRVQLNVYDVRGQKVRTLVNTRQAKGTYSITFSADGLSSGVYFYRLSAGDFNHMRKMILLK